MRRRTRAELVSLVVVASMGAAVTSALAAPPDAYDRPGKTERVSVASSGAQGNAGTPAGGGDPFNGVISPDGRYVVFHSFSSNLVPGDTNQAGDLFWRDRKTGRTLRVSVASDGSQLIPNPLRPSLNIGSISADGRYVAFATVASNLVPGDTNLAFDVFVHDVKTRRTTRESVASNGSQGNAGSTWPSLNADGRYVAFDSDADNLVPGDANNTADVFVRDRWTRKTVLASRSSSGTQANGFAGGPKLSANGRHVAFSSNATNLVLGDTNGAADVYRRDLKTGKTVRVSVASGGAQASFAAIPNCVVGGSVIPLPLPPPSPISELRTPGIVVCSSALTHYGGGGISADGRFVAFSSNATNLVPNDGNFSGVADGWDVFVHDVLTGRTERTSVDSYGQEHARVQTRSGVLSPDGRYVAHTTSGYQSAAACVAIPGPVRAVTDVVSCAFDHTTSDVYDRLTGADESLTVSRSGKEPKPGPCNASQRALGIDKSISTATAITPGGRYVVLLSSGQDLVPGDTNQVCDTFVRDRGPRAGIGGFGSAGLGTGPGADEVCGADGVCLPQLSTVDSGREVRVTGADLIGARLMPRPGLRDLFVRLDLAQMPAVAVSPSGGLLYGMRFAAGGERYEVRAQRVPGADFDAKGGASFGLFRQDRVTGLFTKVASLKGGYGTTGPSVVVAVPLNKLGAANGGRLSDVRAFTGVGSYVSGTAKVLDSLRLAR